MGVNRCLVIALLLCVIKAGCCYNCQPTSCGCEDESAGLKVNLTSLSWELTQANQTLVTEGNVTYFIQLCGLPDGNIPSNCSNNTLVCGYDGVSYASFDILDSVQYEVSMLAGEWSVVINATGDDERNVSVQISRGDTTLVVTHNHGLILDIKANASFASLQSASTETPSPTPAVMSTTIMLVNSTVVPHPATTMAPNSTTSTIIVPPSMTLNSTVIPHPTMAPNTSSSSAAANSTSATPPPTSTTANSTSTTIPSSSMTVPPNSTPPTSTLAPSTTMMAPNSTAVSSTTAVTTSSMTVTQPSINTSLPARSTTSQTVSSSPSASPSPCQSCSSDCTEKVALAVGISAPLTAIVTFFVTIAVCLCCQKAKKKRSYIRLAPTVYFDEEEQD